MRRDSWQEVSTGRFPSRVHCAEVAVHRALRDGGIYDGRDRLYLPDRYRSKATIQIQAARVNARSDQVRSAAEPRRAVDELAIESVDAPRKLEKLIEEFDLYPEIRRSESMEDVVERMNRDITVGEVRGNTFKVSFRPRIASRRCA